VDRNSLAKTLAYLHKAGTSAIFELAVLEPEDGYSNKNISLTLEPLTKGILGKMAVQDPPVNGLVRNISLHLQMNGPTKLRASNVTDLALQVFQFQINLIGALVVK
jgi:hypothetical protein